MTPLFTPGGQSIPVNIQGWFPFRIDWFDLLAVQGTLKSLLQHHNWKAWILQCSAFFPCSSVGKESAYSARDFGSIPGSGRSPGEGNDNPLQYSCLENPHEQRSLADYSPWCRKSKARTQQLNHHHSLLSGPTLRSIHDYWKNHSFDYTNLCWQSDVSAF